MVRTSYADSLTNRSSKLYESSPKFKKWYDDLSVSISPRTAQGYADSLAGFVQDVKISPNDLLKLNSDDAYDLMRSWAISKRKSGKISDGRIKTIWHGVKNYFTFHKIKIDGRFPFSKIATKYFDKIPTKDELKQILDSTSTIQTKIAIQLMAYSGIRPIDICDLTYGSIKTDFEKNIIPCVALIPQSKTSGVYITFLPQQTVDLLRRYFKTRIEKGENITDSNPILKSQQSEKPTGIRRKTLTQNIEYALKKSGVELETKIGDKVRRIRPYCFRKYFRNNLASNVPFEFSEAWLGHTTGLAQVYNGVRDFDPATAERMREAYKNSVNHLVVEGIDEEVIMQRVNKEMSKQQEEVDTIKSQLTSKNSEIELLTSRLQHVEGILKQGGYEIGGGYTWLDDHKDKLPTPEWMLEGEKHQDMLEDISQKTDISYNDLVDIDNLWENQQLDWKIVIRKRKNQPLSNLEFKEITRTIKPLDKSTLQKAIDLAKKKSKHSKRPLIELLAIDISRQAELLAKEDADLYSKTKRKKK